MCLWLHHVITLCWSRHKKSCASVPNALLEQMKQKLADKDRELAAKDEQLQEQREEIKMFEKLLAKGLLN